MTEPGCNYVTPLSCHSFPDVSCCLVIKMTVNYNSHQCITITVTTTLMIVKSNDPVLPGIYDIGDRDSVFVYI